MTKNRLSSDEDERLHVQEVIWREAAEKPQIFLDYTFARERGDQEQINRLEKKNSDLKEIYDEVGPCDPTDYAAYGRIIRLRYDLLHENETYRRYCKARLSKAKAARKIQSDIEKAHPKIAEIFSDWGHTTHVEEDRDKWIEKNRHLFYPLGFTAANAGEKTSKGQLSIAFPSGIQRSKLSIKKSRYALIDKYFDLAKEVAAALNETPKYAVAKVSGESYAATYQRLYACKMVATHIRDGETLADTARRFFTIPGISTFAPEKSKSAYIRNTRENRERHVRTLREAHLKGVECIIDGVFPVKKVKAAKSA